MTNLTVDTARTTSTDLATLDQAMRDKITDTVAASKAVNTLRAYQSDMRQVCKYLADTGNTDLVRQTGNTWHLVKPMPAALICAYLVERSEQGTALTSLQRHVASVSKWHQVVAANQPGVPNPCKTQLVRDTLAGLRKQNQRQPEKAKPLTPGQVSAIVHALELHTLAGLRDRAIVLLGWCAALRRSELANLKWSQVKFVPEGLQITVMQAKTDADGLGQVIGVPYQDNAALCPVMAMVEYAKRTVHDPTNDTRAVFTRITHHDNHTHLPLSGQAIGNIVNACARRVGLDGYTGHSLRSGLATAAILAGQPEHQVMTTTRHRSQAVFRGYVHQAELFTKAASRGLLS